MDLVTRCREKLAYFRIKELKDVLGQMNQPKQGKKQDLVDRILSLVSDDPGAHRWVKRNSLGRDAVVKIIDDTYRKLQVHGAPDLASKSHSGSDFNTNSNHNNNKLNYSNNHNHNHLRPKEEIEDSPAPLTKVRCLCGSSYITESMIKCEDITCQIWQHLSCVIIPEKLIEGVVPELPSTFYCELCRLKRADPFWITISHPLPAHKFTTSGIAPDGTSTLQTVERTFQLSRNDRELLQRTEYDLQVWCMLLNDKVQFRMQWPQFADLQINGISVRVIPRPGSQLLGINGRDDGPVITTLSREGLNKICLGRCDSRTFCFGIRVVKKRSLQQVLSLIPKEESGESFEESLNRVKRCVGGGNTSEDNDSDSDLEVVAESVTVNLRCPMSGSRIKVAGRFKPCLHMQCFDLDAFVELNQRSRKWQCPTCLKNYSLEKIVIDSYFNRITSLMSSCGEDVCEIEVKPDGSWRVKGETDNRDLARWHSSDGSLIQQLEPAKKPLTNPPTNLVKQEATSEGYTGLKLGIKRNRNNGKWEVKKPLDPVNKKPSLPGNPFPGNGNPFPGKPENHFQRVMHMTSSSDSYRDGDDPSVNQFDLSLNNGPEFDSINMTYNNVGYNINTTTTTTNNNNNNLAERASPQQKESAVIVLSDSDEDDTNNRTFYEPGPSGEASGFPMVNRFAVDPVYNGGTTGLGLFNNPDEFNMNPGTSMGLSSFQFFGTETNVPGHHLNGYGLDGDAVRDVSEDPRDFTDLRNGAELASLVDNPLAFGGEDPTLQIFLPTRPTGGASSLEDGFRAQEEDVRNGLGPDDWMSLSLAAGGARDEEVLPADFFNVNQNQQHTAKARMDRSNDNNNNNNANVHLSMNGDTQETLNNNTPDYLFAHPRQPRSARPRNCLSIDTESDSE